MLRIEITNEAQDGLRRVAAQRTIDEGRRVTISDVVRRALHDTDVGAVMSPRARQRLLQPGLLPPGINTPASLAERKPIPFDPTQSQRTDDNATPETPGESPEPAKPLTGSTWE